MARDHRPLSPHLGIYRWQISNTLSIIHRMTGVLLSLGAVVLVAWLVSLASGYTMYATVHGLLTSALGVLLLFGWTFCLFYHLANGVRHLVWDVGLGFEIRQARRSGILVVVFALLMTAGFWLAALTAGGN